MRRRWDRLSSREQDAWLLLAAAWIIGPLFVVLVVLSTTIG